ncbi:hypothetical protein JXA70_15255 [candidate division KSB1 bacterium]|nr:hypothetical protein [candidate division KSB1 bacterium]
MKSFTILLAAFTLLTGCASAPPKVFYINSYHPGYSSSDAIADGIREPLLRANNFLF